MMRERDKEFAALTDRDPITSYKSNYISTGRENLLHVVNAVREGRDALRARYTPGVADPNVSAEQRSWRGGYLAGWQDAYLATQIAAAQSSAQLADPID